MPPVQRYFRRAVRNMPMRRRKDGLTQFAVHNIKASFVLVRQLLAPALILPISFSRSILIVSAAFIFLLIMECLIYVKLNQKLNRGCPRYGTKVCTEF
jgi:hypothetical protein